MGSGWHLREFFFFLVDGRMDVFRGNSRLEISDCRIDDLKLVCTEQNSSLAERASCLLPSSPLISFVTSISFVRSMLSSNVLPALEFSFTRVLVCDS